MVYDFSEPKSDHKSEGSNQWRLPSLGDRLAAVVVDFGILGLAWSLLLAPIKRQYYISSHVGEKADVAVLSLLSLFLIVIIGIAYQTYFVWKQGATPGQKAFRIRVVHLWDAKQPEFMTALVRAIFWWADTLLLGIPHLAVFSNTQRRPMHDRLADTIVTSIGPSSSTTRPNGLWLNVGKVTIVSAFLATTLYTALELSNRFYRIEALEDWQEDLGDIGVEECPEVNEARESWPEDASRLAIAMALFSAEVAGNECIEAEAYRAFKNGEEIDLAYLTRAFSRNEDPELSDAYLKKVCEVAKSEDETCVFSQLIENWTEKNWDAATKIFTSILPNSRAFVKIWAIKHFERTKDFDRELELIDQLGPRKALASFLGSHRALALWGLHRKDEARAALAATMENMTSSERISLASWFCYRELLDGCGGVQTSSCHAFGEDIEENQESLIQSLVAVTALRFEECRPDQKVDYDELMDRVPGVQATQLITSSKYLKQGKSQEAREILKSLGQGDTDRVFAADAQMRLVHVLETESDLGEVIESWETMDHSVWEWRRLGRALFDRLKGLGLHSKAFSLGAQIVDNDPADRELLKTVVVTGYKAGLKLEAWNLLKSRVSSRQLASQKEDFNEIEAELEKQFSGVSE